MERTGEKTERGEMGALSMEPENRSLVAMFTTCVLCLGSAVENAPTVAKALRVSVIRLRLTRWGEAVEIFKDPTLSNFTPFPDDLLDARRALLGIIALFDGEPSVAKTTNKSQARNDTAGADEDRQLLRILHELASERLRGRESAFGPSHPQPSEWSDDKSVAAADRISHLESIFGSDQLRDRVTSELARIRSDTAITRLRAVASSPYNLDPWVARRGINSFSNANLSYTNAWVYQSITGDHAHGATSTGVPFGKDAFLRSD